MRFYRQLESAFVQNAMPPANTSYAKKHHTKLYLGIYSYIDNIYARKLWAHTIAQYLEDIIWFHTNINHPNTSDVFLLRMSFLGTEVFRLRIAC